MTETHLNEEDALNVAKMQGNTYIDSFSVEGLKGTHTTVEAAEKARRDADMLTHPIIQTRVRDI